MDPFIQLPEYPFVICKVCRVACVADEAKAHLHNQHSTISTSERARIFRLIADIPGIIKDQRGLYGFQFPQPTIKPIPFIMPPKTDGLRCNRCSFVTRTIDGMQKHCRKEHSWTNRRGRGGNLQKKARQEWEVPWTTGIRCQRFFKSRAASGWFEVGQSSQPVQPAQPGDAETIDQRIIRLHKTQAERFEQRGQELIRAGDQKAEPNSWLGRVGWAEHLKGLDADRLRNSIRPIEDDEPVLQRMWESMERVMDMAQAAVTPWQVGQAVLFEINRKEVHIKPRKPFDSRLEDDTWIRYKTAFRKLLCFIHRTQDWDDEDRPAYDFTEKQGKLFDAFAEAAGAEQDGQEARVDRLGLDAIVAMFDHEFKHGQYENAIISGLAVMGLRDDGGWVSALDYTPIYSAVIKVVRMLVVYQSIVEQREEIRELEKKMDRVEALEASTGLFRIVRSKVQRFMTTVTVKTQPGPMDWIFESRTYGLRIRFTTAASPVIDWVGEQVVYQKIRFTMSMLADMLHELVGEMKVLVGELMMVGDDFDAVPRIEWDRIQDDHSEDRVGYSFLQDDRNTWLEKGEEWVLKQMLQRQDKKAEWISRDTDTVPYRQVAVRKYGKMVDKYREGMLMMMHMLGGMPARAWEIIEIRHTNTAYGGVHNIMVDRGMVVFVTLYHKNYCSTDQVKVIHRYLPREAGELLLWYLWLVLPFWQQVQGMVKEAAERSAFLWADEIVRRGGTRPRRRGTANPTTRIVRVRRKATRR